MDNQDYLVYQDKKEKLDFLVLPDRKENKAFRDHLAHQDFQELVVNED